MQAPANGPTVTESVPADALATAFHDVHATRLYGFALLVSLGDRRRAEYLAADALSAGAAHIDELRHPERAAAWLRHHVVARSPSKPRSLRADERAKRAAGEARRDALDALGVDAATLAGLTALDVRGRAALIATAIERFDRTDVGTIVGMSGGRLERCIRSGRAQFLAAAATTPSDDPGDPGDDGPIAARIRAIVARTIG